MKKLPVVAPRGYAADQWHFSIRLGFAQQRVEIGGVEVLNFGQSASIDALPRIRSSYVGREAAASWREEALSRIEQWRKGDFVVRLQDAAGKPIAGASIRATLARHRFGFGSCASMTLLQTGPDADRYRHTLASLFSCAVVENELKWPAIRGHQYANSDAIVDWLRDAGLPADMAFRGNAKRRVEVARKSGAGGVVFVRKEDDPRGALHLQWFGQDAESFEVRDRVLSALGLPSLVHGNG